MTELREIVFIYCLDLQSDGSYVALNRHYKPVGFFGKEWVKYEDFPVRFKFKRALSSKQIAALSFDANTDPKRIYFYNDGCIPSAGAAQWAAYSERLERLISYKIVD